jgi:hypothetical protein
MDINQFIQQTGGKWFSQRTTYNLLDEQVENSKADLTMEILLSDHPKVIQLCQQYKINSNSNVKAILTDWDTSPDWGKSKQIGSRMLLLVADESNDDTGKIFRCLDESPQKIISGRYLFAKDESLTLTLEQDQNYVEERIWFPSSNFRLRSIIIKHNGYCVQTSFYSEIRKVLKN